MMQFVIAAPRSGSGKTTAACALLAADLPARIAHMRSLRECFEQGLASLGAQIFAQGSERLPNTSFFAFAGITAKLMNCRIC
jgi:cysteine desulfurase